MFLAMAAPVSAAWPVNGDCDLLDNGHSFFGGLVEFGTQGVVKNGASAQLYTDESRFQPCVGGGSGIYEGDVSQWVGIQAPGIGTDPWNIVQIGLDKCQFPQSSAPTDSPCYPTHAGRLVYFYAWGANSDGRCPGGGTHSPRAIYLGDAPMAGYHTFSITHPIDTDRVFLWVDGISKGSFSDANLCWLYSRNYTMGVYSAERHDPNDGFGGVGPVHFNVTRYQENWGTTWLTADWTSTASCINDPEFQCIRYAGNHFGFQTVNVN